MAFETSKEIILVARFVFNNNLLTPVDIAGLNLMILSYRQASTDHSLVNLIISYGQASTDHSLVNLIISYRQASTDHSLVNLIKSDRQWA